MKPDGSFATIVPHGVDAVKVTDILRRHVGAAATIERRIRRFGSTDVKIINGYVCRTSCDERAAKQGKDPRNPHADPVKQRLLAEADALKGKRPKDAGRVEPVRP